MDEAPEKKKREYKDMEEKGHGDLHARVDMNTVSVSSSSRTHRSQLRFFNPENARFKTPLT